MPKQGYTHLVFLNNKIDEKIWSLYAPFCTEIQYKGSDKKHPAMLCSKPIFTASYLEVTAHFKSNEQIKIHLPSSLVLLIREVSNGERISLGFAPQVSQ